jgi:phage tail-like protein
VATQRDRPYSQFNFTVQIGTDNGQGTNAGFQEVSGLGAEIHIAEYRAGNYKDNGPIKINGSYKVNDVTLKRGVIGELALLYNWFKATQAGGNDTGVLLTVIINLLSEDRTTVAQTWTLANARPMKYTGPSLTGKGTDVAVDELVLSCEGITLS